MGSVCVNTHCLRYSLFPHAKCGVKRGAEEKRFLLSPPFPGAEFFLLSLKRKGQKADVQGLLNNHKKVDVGSSYTCEAEFAKVWIVHPPIGNVSWVLREKKRKQKPKSQVFWEEM